MSTFFRASLLVAISLAVWGTVVPSALAGFGITPPAVRNDKLGRGTVFTQDIILVRGDPVEDLMAELTVSAPGFDGWISIDKGNRFLLPKGAQQVPIKVTVQVPQDASYDRYQGYIRIKTTSPDPASGVSIALGAQIDIDIRVQDKIKDFEVRRVLLSETEAPRQLAWLMFPGKITFTMELENTGNAPVAPSKVVFELLDKRNTTVLETVENTNVIEEVNPFETKDVKAFLPTRLPPGAYLVRYSIFHFEDQVKKSGELTLSVLPRGTLSAYIGYGFEGLSRADQISLFAPIAVLLIALIAGALIVRGRRARRRRRPPHGADSYDNAPPAPRHPRQPEYYEEEQLPRPPLRRPTTRPPATSHGVVDLSGRRRTQ